MKQIIRIDKNKFITLDSYGESNETRLGTFLMALLVVAIAAMTACAMFGIDITAPPLTPSPSGEQIRP